MEEKLLVSLQELKSAIDSGGNIDTGDLSYDSLKTILEFFIEQEKENKRYIIKMTDEQYSRVIELVECDINKKWKDKIKAFIKEELPDDEICSYCETFDINGIDLKRKLQSLLEDNTEEIEETNLCYVTCESDFKNMDIVKLLNEFFEKNDLIVNELVRAVNKIRRNKNVK